MTSPSLAEDPYVAKHPQTRPFWEAAAEGRFILPRCRGCGRAHWYPRAICPFCASTDLEWERASGSAEIYSFSVMRRTASPYVVAYVTLAEGPTMMTNIVDCLVDEVRIGQLVSVRFMTSTDGRAMPVFAPARES